MTSVSNLNAKIVYSIAMEKYFIFTAKRLARGSLANKPSGNFPKSKYGIWHEIKQKLLK